MFTQGKGENLTKQDMSHPNFRQALQTGAGHKLKKNEYNALLEVANKKEYHRVEVLAKQYGLGEQEAIRLKEVAQIENRVAKHQKEVKVKNQEKFIKMDTKKELSDGISGY